MPNIGEPFFPQKKFTNGGWTGPICPRTLLEREELTPAAKLVWLALSNCAGKNGECFPSYKYLAEATGLSERGVKNVAEKLKENGWLTWDSGRKGKSNRYHLLWTEAFDEEKY